MRLVQHRPAADSPVNLGRGQLQHWLALGVAHQPLDLAGGPQALDVPDDGVAKGTERMPGAPLCCAQGDRRHALRQRPFQAQDRHVLGIGVAPPLWLYPGPVLVIIGGGVEGDGHIVARPRRPQPRGRRWR
jgi:hypothetical protein